ncbi:MAG: nitroreductase/quinone reductase family protein [Acidimicrobiia bacterium]|nr:nitroreductase/quinone reductase family protein [Acidimicrobiia bacterium]
MGLQEELGYRSPRVNNVQRALHDVVAIPWLSPVLSKLFTPVDRAFHRMTGGRASVSGALVGFPVVVLTTTGAKSGQLRTTPLSAVPLGDDLALIGSNAGSGKIPGWAHNLRANPTGTVAYEGREAAVKAREADPDEYEAAFDSAVRVYPGYAGYRERADYVIPVFVLEAANAA